MIHIDKAGNVIGSFDPPQGHGMAVDSKGFVYLGNSVKGLNTVRKYDPKTGMMLMEVPRVPAEELLASVAAEPSTAVRARVAAAREAGAAASREPGVIHFDL